VQFANSNGTKITNCFDRLPQSNTIYVQLYFTPDLTAVTNESARASMVPVGTPKILPFGTSTAAYGRFQGGTVTLPGVPGGAQVVLQVKAWTTNYTSFEDAVINGGEVAESLPWVQTTGSNTQIPPTPPSMIWQWGFRPFPFPQCEPLRVPLTIERLNPSTVRVNWPVGFPPALQVNDGSGTNWQALTSGMFVQDHWEFQVPTTNGVQLFRLAQ
jgi:hypothetical protein